MFSQEPVLAAEQASAVYHVSGSAPFALGHYPGDPVFPGVMSLKCMRILSEALFSHIHPDVELGNIKLKRVSFVDIVRPGDVLTVTAEVKKAKDGELHLQSLIEVDGAAKSKSVFVFSY